MEKEKGLEKKFINNLPCGKDVDNLKPLAYNPVYPPTREMWEKTEGKMSVIERILKCVVFLGRVSDPEGFNPRFVPYGTGFLCAIFHQEGSIRDEDKWFDYIITCKHILDEIAGDTVWVRLNLKEGGSRNIPTFKKLWVFDPKNDIAVLSDKIGELFNVCRIIEKDVVTKAVLGDHKWSHGGKIMPAVDTILVGLFTSHYGLDYNIPIVRIGTIAAMPDDLIETPTGYVKAYLIETRSIGGLSGSPVFLSDEFKWLFLGMMRARFNIKDPTDVVRAAIRNDEELKKDIAQLSPKLQKVIVGLMEKYFLVDDINTGIGIVIPAEVIMNFINQPVFVAQREETVKELKKKSPYRDSAAIPALEENPQHKEDFNSLVSAAAKKKPPADKT